MLRKHAGKVCVCELVPLFDLSQPTVSHHLKVLREAGIVDSERRGLWAYYYVDPRRTGGAVRMAELTDTDIRERVRERYAAAATAVATRAPGQAAAAPRRDRRLRTGHRVDRQARQRGLRRRPLRRARATPAPRAAVEASLGCGVPTAVADLHEGETVLDLGSGAGADVLISARRVGPSGKAIGLDMTDEMLELARANAAEAGVDERRVRQGLHRGDPAARRLASTW